MEEEFVFKPSAFKHGIAEPDIRNAFKQRMLDYAMSGEEYKNLLLGLARDGSLLEVMYNVLDGDVINRVVRKLQFLNNFLIKSHFCRAWLFQKHSPKNARLVR